jgi:hypothetical protein
MAETARKPVLTGGCQCGAVRYALYAEPTGAHLCHCRMCQKAVGNVFAALAPVKAKDFAWTRGSPSFYKSSSIAERGFCAQCGTPLSFSYIGSDEMDVTIGSLDHPDQAAPGTHYGVESRVAWLKMADGLPEWTTDTSMQQDRLQALVNCQHPDAETESAGGDGW